MATKVRKLRIEELSGVDRPANQEGWMVLVKNYQARGLATLQKVAERLGLGEYVAKSAPEGDDDDDLLDEIEAELDELEDDEHIGKSDDDDLTDDELDEIEAELDDLDEDDNVQKGVMCKGCGKKPMQKGAKGMCADCASESVGKSFASGSLEDLIAKQFGDAASPSPISKNQESPVKLTGSEVESIVKSLTPAARELVTELITKNVEAESAVAKANEQLTTLSKAVEKLVETNADAQLTTLAKSLIPPNAPITVEEAKVLLKSAGDNADARAAVEKTLKTMGQLAASSSLFKSFGDNPVTADSAGESSAVTAINKAAGELRTAKPTLTAEQAVAEALTANPALYEQFMAASQQ